MKNFQLLLKVFNLGIIIFFIVPLGIIVSVSFTQGQFLSFPPEGFSIKWYKEVFSNYDWLRAIINSFLIAISVSFLSTSMAGVLAFVLDRYNIKLAKYIRGLGFLPILLPPVTFGVAIMSFFYSIRFSGSLINVIVAHSIFFLPFPLVLISAGLAEIDKSTEEAALTLGATNVKVFQTITLPLIRSNIFAAMLFAFVLSLNEYIVAYLTAGFSVTTMPIKIFSSLRYALSPDIAVVSTLFIIITTVIIIIVNRITGGIWQSM